MGPFGIQALQVIVTAGSEGKEFVFGHGSGSDPSTQGAADYTIREPACKIGTHPTGDSYIGLFRYNVPALAAAMAKN